MLPSNLSEVVEHIAKEQRAKVAAEIAEAQSKLIATSYDKAASYTTVIIFGGYAGFFAIWQLSKQYLSKGQTLWSALLILISLLAFVLFEVFKMVLVTRAFVGQAKVLALPEVRGNPDRLLQELKALEQLQRNHQRGLMVVWAVVVAICVGCALVGTSILGYAFVSGLAR